MDGRYSRFWSTFLGVDLAAQAAASVRVVPHRALGGYSGAWIFEMHGRMVVSVPTHLVPAMRERLALATPTLAGCEHAFASLAVARRIGPAVHMGVDRAPSVASASIQCADAAAIAALKAEIPAQEWDDAGIAEQRSHGAPVLAVMDGDTVAALASYEALPGRGANPGLVVGPRHRGRGFGKAALAAITARCIEDHLLPVLQTLEANRAMTGCAAAVGYRVHARHVALRLAQC